MPEWRDYIHDRLISEEDGFYVIVPRDAEACVPLSCPLCDTLMRSRDDEGAYLEFECCHSCAIRWAHCRKDSWHSGWRPSREKILEERDARPPLAIDTSIL